MNSLSSPIDTARAEAYEKYLVPHVFGPWAEYMVELAQPRLEDHALDLACGTGAATRLVARRTVRTVGVDVDPAMLAVAQRHSDPALSIQWRCSDAGRLDFADGTFDLCLCLQGLQHFAERERAVKEVHRVLKPRGRLVAAVWARIDLNPGLLAVLHALQSEDIDASAFQRPFALGDAAALEAVVRREEFSSIEVRLHERPARFASVEAFLLALSVGSVASREALQNVSQKRWSVFAEQISKELAPFTSAEGLVIPYRAQVAIAAA